MTDQQIRQIMSAMEEQNKVLSKLTKDGEDRANAYGELAVFLKKNLAETNNKLEQVAKKQDAATEKLDPESPKYILTEFKPMLKSYNDANTIVSFFQHGVVKTLFLVAGIAGAIMTIREFLKK